jgi:myo-inositol 2-dehydrogenase/D-chiro-inositol 1-dehydrogenase
MKMATTDVTGTAQAPVGKEEKPAPRISRRRFIAATLGGTALAGAGYMFGRRPVRLAIIGAGGQGVSLARAIQRAWWLGDMAGKTVAVCDVDRTHAADLGAEMGADVYHDYRQVLERDDVAAVVIATPDHWHTAIAVAAMRANKAVYCEKPISLTIDEGKLLVRTVQETGQVFLAGTLQRTDYRFRTACELVRNGRLGKLHTVKVTLPMRWAGENGGPFPTTAPPAELDWDTWLGQAPYAEYCPERCHGFFRRWYEYSGGQMTDWGTHNLDIAHWAMGMDDSGPLTVSGQAQLPRVTNGFNTPLEFSADMRYPNDVLVQVRTAPTEAGVRFEGDGGWLLVQRKFWEGSAVEELAKNPLPSDAIRLHDVSPARYTQPLVQHLLHFFRCVRHGERPISDVVSQHRSASACHLANISMRLGRPISWDAERQQIVRDDEANAMLQRPQRSGFALPT